MLADLPDDMDIFNLSIRLIPQEALVRIESQMQKLIPDLRVVFQCIMAQYMVWWVMSRTNCYPLKEYKGRFS